LICLSRPFPVERSSESIFTTIAYDELLCCFSSWKTLFFFCTITTLYSSQNPTIIDVSENSPGIGTVVVPSTTTLNLVYMGNHNYPNIQVQVWTFKAFRRLRGCHAQAIFPSLAMSYYKRLRLPSCYIIIMVGVKQVFPSQKWCEVFLCFPTHTPTPFKWLK
jgi:hypothetical protein